VEIDDNDLLVEVDGPGFDKKSVDPRGLLALASSYIKLLDKVAADEEAEIVLSGLRIENKCVAVATRVSDPNTTWGVIANANRYIAGGAKAPYGVRGAVDAVLSALHELPPETKAGVRVGSRVAPISATSELVAERPWAVTTIWATLLKVGGPREKVWLKSGSEPSAWSLEVDLELARKLGPHLKKELLIEMLVSRNSDGQIEGGKLISFQLPDVEQGHEAEAWRRWFKEAVDVEGTKSDLAKRGDD
jgi:hypothetical protein